MKNNLQMVDLVSQYKNIEQEINDAVINTIRSGEYINGSEVSKFAEELTKYTGAKYVIPCANGTDALQIAFMALGLQPGDEVIVPAFTYVATAEVIALLKLIPVMVDVDPLTFGIDLNQVKAAINPKTKAIVPVHLFGQCIGMEELMEIADKYKLAIVEDTAQAIGAKYTFKDGSIKQAGTIGTIGTTSFFPSKNLGCYGDGGAIFTNNPELARLIKMIANHGQEKKYYHDIIGVNSRLDTIQAAILRVKLKYLDTYTAARNQVALKYDNALKDVKGLIIPCRVNNSTHAFHQYTLRILDDKRDELKNYLHELGVPTMIYYPLPLHHQKAFKSAKYEEGSFPVSEMLCKEVLSLPIHTEMKNDDQEYIIQSILNFFNK